MVVDFTTAVISLADQAERDDEAVADVRNQARSANAAVRPVLNATASSLDIERVAARAFSHELKNLYDRVATLIRALIVDNDDRAALLNVSRLPMEDLLRRLGMEGMIQKFTAAQVAALQVASDSLRAAGFDDVGALTPSDPTIRAAFDRTLEAFWQEQVVLPTRRVIADAALDALTATSMEGIAQRASRSLDQHVGRATTAARTEVARWSRTVSATSAAQVDAELFAYLGPVDGITRPFCRAIANRILTREQVGELDNGQTPDSPLTAGGGYNCRHGFTPVSQSWADRSGLPFASEGDINDANRSARRAA